jgi:filamentous hemagglutinin family protein
MKVVSITSTTVILTSVFLPFVATAQVTPDSTTSTTVNSTATGVQIENGDRAGGNLFHSFGEFSVPTGSEAYFNNANDIANIFSRVTGGNISNIDGLLRANGTANLFLINPAGILFGPNASLQLGGSFYGSTADSIVFPDGEFSATDLENPPLITINAPIGLGFRDNPAPISVNSTVSADFNPLPSFDDNLFGLRVPDGETFALAGGDITADGGGIVSIGGRIELGAVKEEGIIQLNFDNNSPIFNFSEDLLRGDVSLTNSAGFLVTGGGGGDLAITARNINIVESSGLYAGIFGGLGSSEAQAGDIVINATGVVNLINGSGIFNNVNTDALGNAGDIEITTNSLSLENGSIISSDTYSQGNGGNISVSTPSVSVTDGGFIETSTSGLGNAGNVEIITDNLSVTNAAKILASTFGEGDAGDLSILANNIELNGGEDGFLTGLFASVESGATGEGGSIFIGNEQFPTQQLSLR